MVLMVLIVLIVFDRFDRFDCFDRFDRFPIQAMSKKLHVSGYAEWKDGKYHMTLTPTVPIVMMPQPPPARPVPAEGVPVEHTDSGRSQKERRLRAVIEKAEKAGKAQELFATMNLSLIHI